MSIESQKDNKRVAKNTLFLYIRMLLVMVVSIYTSRVVLDVLGVSDYGIYNVVGGVVTFLGFLNSSMANAVQRFLSFELGKSDTEATARVFSISLMSHIGIAFLFFAVLECAGPWFLNSYMMISPERLEAAHFVLQCSIITALFSFIQVPYNAIIIAKEKMDIYAYVGILEVVLRLLVVYLLQISDFDRLEFYAVLQMLITVGILLFNMVYCRWTFLEARFRYIKDKATFKAIFGFAVWNLIGEFSWAMTGQGVNIILNIFCGTVVNAARGIADQVNAAVMRFVNNFQTALNPQIIKTYSANQVSEMNNLLSFGSRFSFYLLLLLSLPLLLEMNFILNFWLVEVPDYAVAFCQWVLVCSLVSIVTNLFSQVIRATGNIRNYQVSTACVQLLNFPLSYLLLYNHLSPVFTMVIATFIQIVIGVMRIIFVRKMVNYFVSLFLKDIFFPILKVTVCSVVVPMFVVCVYTDGIVRFMTICLLSAVSVLLSSYYWGMEQSERDKILKLSHQYLNKLR